MLPSEERLFSALFKTRIHRTFGHYYVLYDAIFQWFGDFLLWFCIFI